MSNANKVRWVIKMESFDMGKFWPHSTMRLDAVSEEAARARAAELNPCLRIASVTAEK